MDKFEYKTLFTDAKGAFGGKVDKYTFQNELNELGTQGWEHSCLYAKLRQHKMDYLNF